MWSKYWRSFHLLFLQWTITFYTIPSFTEINLKNARSSLHVRSKIFLMQLLNSHLLLIVPIWSWSSLKYWNLTAPVCYAFAQNLFSLLICYIMRNMSIYNISVVYNVNFYQYSDVMMFTARSDTACDSHVWIIKHSKKSVIHIYVFCFYNLE